MKYIELFKNGFDSTITDKTKPGNYPYVGYSPTDGFAFTIVPEENPSGYQMVDLGLPSGLKWADRNIGATRPEDTGLYFQWGDTVGYTVDQVGVDKVFNWDNYKFYTGTADWGKEIFKYHSGDNLIILESMDDAAHINMGDGWYMPTIEQSRELFDNTTHELITNYNGTGINGLLLTGNNGNTLFLPAAGYIDGSSVNNLSDGPSGWYWTNMNRENSTGGPVSPGYPSDAYNMWFNNTVCQTDVQSRCYGLTIRGVHT
jgi:hypothetical protein